MTYKAVYHQHNSENRYHLFNTSFPLSSTFASSECTWIFLCNHPFRYQNTAFNKRAVARNDHARFRIILIYRERKRGEQKISLGIDAKAASQKEKRDSNNRGNRRDLVITEFQCPTVQPNYFWDPNLLIPCPPTKHFQTHFLRASRQL